MSGGFGVNCRALQFGVYGIVLVAAVLSLALGCSQPTTTTGDPANVEEQPILGGESDSTSVGSLEGIIQANRELLDAVRAANQANAELVQNIRSLQQANSELVETIQRLGEGAIPPAVGVQQATPTSEGRTDICYRSIPMQEALFSQFDGPDLCSAVTIGDLYRLEELSIDASRGLQPSDFANLPNLRILVLELGQEGEPLPANLFEHLPSLEHLGIYEQTYSVLNPSTFLGLLNLESLVVRSRVPDDDVDGRQSVTLPNDLFAGAPNLQTLELGLGGYDFCVKLSSRTFKGLTQLETLRFDTEYIRAIPRLAFEDQAVLSELWLPWTCPDEEGRQDEMEIYVANYEVARNLDHRCGDYCVIAGTLD